MKFIGHFKDFQQGFKGDKQIVFTVDNYVDKALIDSLKSDLSYSIEVKEIKSKRSLQQNAYLWALIHEINLTLNDRPIDDMDIYIMLLEKANVKFEYIACTKEAEQGLKKAFRAVKQVKETAFKDKQGKSLIMYKCFLGSSKMDVKEFNMLIDTALDVANELDINLSYWSDLLK